MAYWYIYRLNPCQRFEVERRYNIIVMRAFVLYVYLTLAHAPIPYLTSFMSYTSILFAPEVVLSPPFTNIP
jgi:hypothetical protein